ncbi:MAG: radical SAM protein [Myxococcota bacterium]|nr:radical SAM protein [Myxococcota bacterium]MDW8362817.1 radical SAM protein [Myxococcales bacterium]
MEITTAPTSVRRRALPVLPRGQAFCRTHAPTAYLRVVLTARCPLRCVYCHTEGDPARDRDTSGGLPLDVLEPLIATAVDAGVAKVKFVGGEPLVRRDLTSLVGALRARATARGRSLDLSVITSGVVPPDRIGELFEAGLDRINLSIHGWTEAAFVERARGTATQFRRRAEFLEALLGHGRPLKLNFVYRGPDDETDLGALLEWAAGRPVLVNVLDELGCETLSPEVVRQVVVGLRGEPSDVLEDVDALGWRTLHLVWCDGLRVEIKHQRLGTLAPWTSCPGCPVRNRCREGIDAVRLTHEGVVRPCMDRMDVGIPLVPVLRQGGVEAVREVWTQVLDVEGQVS